MADVIRDPKYLHPRLGQCVERIQVELIDHHRMPFRIFETARTRERQRYLLEQHLTPAATANQYLFDLEADPPVYSTAVAIVCHLNGRFTWNLRITAIAAWYKLIGELVLDLCPDLDWGGYWRRSVDFTHYQLKTSAILEDQLH